MAGPAYYSATMNIAKNDDWIVPFAYADVNGNPIDLTGSTLKLELRVREVDHEAIVSVHSPDHGIYISDAAGGLFYILIDRDHLVRLSARDYFVDLVRLEPNGYQERIFEGMAMVVEGTTR